jgi:uncharacterized membrane protein
MLLWQKPHYSSKTVLQVSLALETLIIAIQLIIPTLIGARPSLFFDEGSIITWLSFLQLLLMGFISYKIYLIKREDKKSCEDFFWLLATVSFVFMAVDDLGQIHENFEGLIKLVFGLKDSFWWRRLDDLFVGMYGAIAVLVIYIFRRDMKQYREVTYLFLIGFILLGFTIFIDLINHHENDLVFLSNNLETRQIIYKYLGPIEEMFKIWAEGFFLAGIYGCWRISDQKTQIQVACKFDNP